MSDKGRKISAAVIGVGHLGQWHARKIAAMRGVRLSAIVDTNIKRARKLANELGCRAYKSIDDLPQGTLDAAVIATPTVNHFEMADHLLTLGIDLLVEKPLAENVADAAKLVEKARRLNRIIAVGHIERMNPAYRASLGEIDHPFLIETSRLSPLKKRAIGIDVVRDLMIHDIDLAIQIAGSCGMVVVEEAIGAKVVTDMIDVARVHLRFDSGVHAFMLASRIHADEMREIEIFDAKGLITINCLDRKAGRFKPDSAGMVYRAFRCRQTDALEEELKNFFGAVRKRSQPAATGLDGLKALSLCEEIIKRIMKGL
jgi:predicted dehydrogenase